MKRDIILDILSNTAQAFVFSAFLWLPIVFAAYAIARRKTSLRLLFAFVAIEGIALGYYGRSILMLVRSANASL
jgi:hypothetical protein